MGQGRLSRTICLQFLLVASAIQGITPDAQDLGSAKALWVFCPVLADAGSLADDDGLPDEVCGPAQSAALIIRMASSDDVAYPAFASTEPLLAPIQASALRSNSRRPCSARINELIYSLCRINC
jgi:hypothetical protein